MKRIPLRARDGSVRAEVLVDDDVFEVYGGLRWALHSQGYAYRQASTAGGRRARTMLLHRLICGLAPRDGWEVDHKNRDRLDCRRENLRVVPAGGSNAQNMSGHRDARSRFRGVALHQCGRWHARVRQKHVGLFATELEAAIAAEAYRREVMPFAAPDPELERALSVA